MTPNKTYVEDDQPGEKIGTRLQKKNGENEGTKNKHAGAEDAAGSRENIKKHFLFLFSQKASGIWFGLTKHPLPKVGNRYRLLDYKNSCPLTLRKCCWMANYSYGTSSQLTSISTLISKEQHSFILPKNKIQQQESCTTASPNQQHQEVILLRTNEFLLNIFS